MVLRIYATAVTLVLIAALTNPSAEDHYAKLAVVHPWVKDSLIEDAQVLLASRLQDAPCDNGEEAGDEDLPTQPPPPALVYTSLGVASFVQIEDRWPTCLHTAWRAPISAGLFGYVFIDKPPDQPTEDVESSQKSKLTPARGADLSADFSVLMPDSRDRKSLSTE